MSLIHKCFSPNVQEDKPLARSNHLLRSQLSLVHKSNSDHSANKWSVEAVLFVWHPFLNEFRNDTSDELELYMFKNV